MVSSCQKKKIIEKGPSQAEPKVASLFCLNSSPKPKESPFTMTENREKAANSHIWEPGTINEALMNDFNH